MRFVIAERIEDTYDQIRDSWWGKPEKLHIDAWGELKYADGYNIQFKNEPTKDTENKLFFVNLGGYDSNEFTELHKNVFIVAPNESKAKVKALKQILHWESYHKDYLFEVENILDIAKITAKEDLYLHLEETDDELPFEFTCKYTALEKK